MKLSYRVIERLKALGKSMLAQAVMPVVFVLNEQISLGTSYEVTAKK